MTNHHGANPRRGLLVARPMRSGATQAGDWSMDGAGIEALAADFGTPLYVYSSAALRNRFQLLRDSFSAALAPLDPIIAFSVKACPSIGILSLLAGEGCAFDVVSGGELLRVARAGGDLRRVIFAGVGKRDDELDLALDAGVLQINVESAGELLRLDGIAQKRGVKARAALRVNPGVDGQTHRHLTTGVNTSKFGIPFEQTASILLDRARFRHVNIVGLHVHVGSMIDTPQPYLSALDRIEPLIQQFGKSGMTTMDVGGGLAIERDGRPGLHPATLAASIAPRLLKIGARPIFEPGRWIAAPSGFLLTRVLDRKQAGGRTLLVVDAAMNDLIRPALYDAVHPMMVLGHGRANDTETIIADVVGPICESGDILGRELELPTAKAGDLVAILDAGAYGFSMASNYNSRPRPAEVMVDASRAQVIRERESLDDLMRGERVFR